MHVLGPHHAIIALKMCIELHNVQVTQTLQCGAFPLELDSLIAITAFQHLGGHRYAMPPSHIDL